MKQWMWAFIPESVKRDQVEWVGYKNHNYPSSWTDLECSVARAIEGIESFRAVVENDTLTDVFNNPNVRQGIADLVDYQNPLRTTWGLGMPPQGNHADVLFFDGVHTSMVAATQSTCIPHENNLAVEDYWYTETFNE